MTARVRTEPDRGARLVSLLLAYLALWALEGALRKWVLEGVLQQAAYLVRVPVVAAAVWCLRDEPRLRRLVVAPLLVVAAAACYSAGALLLGQASPLQAVLGLRGIAELVLMTCVVASAGSAAAAAVMRAVVLLTPPLVLLGVAQVRSPADALVNKLLAEGGAENFLNHADGVLVVRATATFTAPAGYAYFLVLSLACSLALILHDRRSALGYAGVVLGGVGCLTSGSRLAVYLALPAAAVAVVAFARSRTASAVPALVLAGVGAFAAVAIANAYAPAAVTALQGRLEGRTTSQEDTPARVVDNVVGFVDALASAPLLGTGPGTLTQGNNGNEEGASVEIELERWVFEFGGPVALVLILCRAAACAYVAVQSCRTAPGSVLAAASVPTAMFGLATAQGSVIGFTALGLGLGLALATPTEQTAASERRSSARAAR